MDVFEFRGDSSEESTAHTPVQRCIYIITMRYADEVDPDEKDFAGMILCAIGVPDTSVRTRSRSNEEVFIEGDSVWHAEVDTDADLERALDKVGALLVARRTNSVATVVLSVHGWTDGVSVNRYPTHGGTIGWGEVMERLQAARWTALGVLLMLDCCKTMSGLPSANKEAALQLTKRLGLSGLATDVIAAGYVDGSGEHGWAASAECCIAGIKAAWTGDWKSGAHMASIVEKSASSCTRSADILGGFRCLPLGIQTARWFEGDFGGYGFYQTTLSRAAREVIAGCVSKTTLTRKTAWGVDRWEVQWFQKKGSWWNPRGAVVAQMTASDELGAIAAKFCKENEETLRILFDGAPEPYKTVYEENRLLGHICAQYFDEAAELTTKKTLHRDGEECFFGMCISIGELPRTFHIFEGNTVMESAQKNGDVYFTSFGLSNHALSRRKATGGDRDTVVIFRPLVTAEELAEMKKDLRALRVPGPKNRTARVRTPPRGGVIGFYERLAEFILKGPIAP